MLKSWSLQNFKPILDSGELKLAPVTVLAGRNSSGKSSLIQSILMIAQTLSSRVLDRALLPTGPIVQLGTFEDILSEQTDLRTLIVGFEIEMGKEEQKIYVGAVAGPRGNIKSVKVTSQFRSPSDNGASDSAIEASKVTIENVSLEVTASHSLTQRRSSRISGSELPLKFDLDIKQLTTRETDEFLKEISPEYLRLVPYSTKETNYLGMLKVKSDEHSVRINDASLIGFSHFLPTRLVKKYAIEERDRSRLVSVINFILSHPDDVSLSFRTALYSFENILTSSKDISDKNIPELLTSASPISQNLREAVLTICKDKSISKAFSGQTLEDLIQWYGALKLDRIKKNVLGHKFAEAIAQSILEESRHIENRHSKKDEALETATNDDPYVEALERGVGQTIQFFTSKIRYLGPLRADPQSSQKFSPSSELDDVGSKGEYAAAVYEANQNARIRWYNPLNKEVERGTLKVALNTWVSYLGVANEIKIQMAGQSGVSWQVVHMEGRKALPLAAVGVGISQILPILVMGLLAPSDTLLLVEQPEPHLHPGIQARLGDFFMGLAKCDKQCLIETHSENLVSQLRYHIVQASGQGKSDCLIYFVDQDQQGAAQFNPIEISEKGNILNWPDGFFDETMLQEDRITAASLKKRAAQAHNG